MTNGDMGTNGETGTRGEAGDLRGEGGGQAGAREALNSLLPLFMAVMGDRQGRRSMLLFLQLQLLFWTLEGAIDGLEALRGVAERARDRLRALAAGLEDGGSGKGSSSAEW